MKTFPLRLKGVASMLAIAALGCTDDTALMSISTTSPNSSGSDISATS